MQTNQSLLLLLFLLAGVLMGEYYLLTEVDPILALDHKNKLQLLLLKLQVKTSTLTRISFIVCYLLWLMTSNSMAIQKYTSKTNRWMVLLLIIFLIASAYSLLSLQRLSPGLIRILYPLAVSCFLLSALLLASFLPTRKRFGVKNDKQKIENSYSFHFKTKDGWINIVNPFRGIFIAGGAGSGKTYSLANPIIYQAVQKGYCGLIYDFKFPTLAEEVNKALVLTKSKEVKHYIVNFSDLSRSHRLNPLKPENMPVVAYAEEYALAIINNLLPESIRKKDFWIRSANAILTAVIWFLKKHHSLYCSIPHVVNCILYKDYLHVMSMLETDPECADMVRSALTAIENEAESQVAGVIGTLQIAIVRINSPEICWVLSGDDFDLDLNNPLDSKLLTLGSDPTLVDTFSPVISCIATVVLKLMNSQGKRHSIVLLDEAPTLYIPKLDVIPATARSNKISTIYMAQDFSQMVASYGKEIADVVIANLNNQFYGRVASAATAKHVSELFGREEKETHSMSSGRSMHEKGQGLSESLSKSMQDRLLVRPQDVTSLQVGEFIGMTVESKQPYFWGQVKIAKLPQGDYKIPAFTSGIAEVENFERIKSEVAAIVQFYPKREMKLLKTKQSI